MTDEHTAPQNGEALPERRRLFSSLKRCWARLLFVCTRRRFLKDLPDHLLKDAGFTASAKDQLDDQDQKRLEISNKTEFEARFRRDKLKL
ncbi:MAG: hypothetical protein HWE23_14150 [Rhodobacteraceae bacterium]|nr:hypothetical protein [Paracoccaceae bacterium]